MITVDLRSRVPIYEQIVDSIKSAILSGCLQPDEQLPAVRKLAVELAINPNTIQKAYSILESQQIVYSLPGRGNFVSADPSALMQSHRAKIMSELVELLHEADRSGIPREEILELIEDYGKSQGSPAEN